jgi:phage shock protein PspC (stress-responsive transcriptional regulator)
MKLHEARMVAGVAAGMADCFDLDPTVVRIGFVALCLLGGVAVARQATADRSSGSRRI